MAGNFNYGRQSQQYGAGMNGGFATQSFSHKAPTLASDMLCYFGCPESFKKEYDLDLHTKLKHKNEDPNELARAYQANEEEKALVRRSCSTFQCALCPKKLHERGSFSDHIKKTHKIQWLDYKDKYGRCEVESAPFECKICGRVVKYGSHTVDVHLKNCHGLSWVQYLQRIRSMRRGEAPEELPPTEFFDCKVCSAQVKFMFRGKHLKGVHKITESEYVELFKDDLKKDANNNMGPSQSFEGGGDYPDVSNPYQMNMQSTPPPMKIQPTPPPMKIQTTPQMMPTPHIQSPPPMPLRRDIDDKQSFNDIKPFYGQPLPYSDLPQPNFQQPEPHSNQSFAKTPIIKPPKSDIQDKNNRKCSSCCVTFESRRAFISHCTIDHNMKFRTASGATIGSSSFGQGNQQSQERVNANLQNGGNNQPKTVFTGTPNNWATSTNPGQTQEQMKNSDDQEPVDQLPLY